MWMPALGRHRLSPTPLPRCLALVASDFGDSETETFPASCQVFDF
ncbi:hypothetical protein CGMCC3_g8779 [Colletotrichum fructicola]|nr:uncharacterized protein CGMCC3_g8779 [Colletotrichum fructicola]KAE9575171.1 hypothetical protein CGMCC3_g8779 [Colletotrichum fructicola]